MIIIHHSSFITLVGACSAGAVERVGGEQPASPAVDAGRREELAAPEHADAAAAVPVEPEPPAREVVVQAAGDVLVHRAVVDSARAQEGGFGYVLSGLRSAIEDPGGRASKVPVVTLVNLETPLTDTRVDPVNTLPPVLGAPPELARALADVGVDVVSLANNHAMDQTPEGLVDSLATARAAGLGVVGVGPDEGEAFRHRTIERGGLKVAFVGFTHHVNGGAGSAAYGAVVALLRENERVMASIAEARAEADVVVVAVHWSSDFVGRPLRDQRDLAHRMIDAGADVIVGTGPHILQEVERLPSPRGAAVVAYSLGNLVSNQGLLHRPGLPPRSGHPVAVTAGTRDAVLLRVHLRAPADGRVEVAAVEAVPMWTANNVWERRAGSGVAADIAVVRLRDAATEVREERRPIIARTLGPVVDLVP
jgi:poly-gamma-glutamate synthesis protein (capsule biosynthesis protein)